MRRIFVGGDLAQEPERICLVSRFFVGLGALERPLGERERIVRSAGEQICLAQPGQPEGIPEDDFEHLGLLHRLFEQRHGVGDPPGKPNAEASKRVPRGM
jgi:hypothetical protein